MKDGILNHEKIKENTKLILEVELSNIRDYTKPKWELNANERLEYSMKQKADGNDEFKAKNFKAACDKYQDGYQSIKEDTGLEYEKLKEGLLMNSAMSCIKIKENGKAIEYAQLVLDMNN